MMVKINCNAIALGFALGGLFASPAAAISFSGAGLKDKSVDDASRRVCRMLTPTGSRFTTRVCKTKAEWEWEMKKLQDAAQGDQRENSDTYQNSRPM